MSERSLTVESLRGHLPFLDKIITRMSGTPVENEAKKMKNIIECGKK